MWGRVQMTQAERTRTIKCVLAESSGWLLPRRKDTKMRSIPGCSEKLNERNEKQKRKAGSKAQKKARRSYSRRLHTNKSSRLCYQAETGTLPHHLRSSSCSRRQRYQVSLLPLSSPSPARTNQGKPNKTAWTRGM